LPLSVAQHNLAALAMRRCTGMLSDAEARRESLNDSTEALLGGWDPITPLKPHLSDVFNPFVASLQTAIDRRYQLPAWDNASHNKHTAAGRLAAASEAFHVVGWPRETMRDDLEILFDPREQDPHAATPGFAPREPWPTACAAEVRPAACLEEAA
jgi:hypothetical protein